jgi:hypothetical protein
MMNLAIPKKIDMSIPAQIVMLHIIGLDPCDIPSGNLT